MLSAILGVLGAFCLTGFAADETAAPATKPAVEAAGTNAEPGAKPKEFKLPGLVINLEKGCVDVEATVCLDEGTLELIACTKDSKEHESIIAVAAKPSHIHAALLLLGARPGNPSMRKPLDAEGTRWIDIPPQGDPIGVYLAFKDKEGKMVEYPISDFIAPTDDDYGRSPASDESEEKAEFPDAFIFAGSHLIGQGKGPRQYLCDQSGNVISIATFGDELICLSGMHASDNGSLMWQINPTKLPEVGTKITLRLRPRGKAGR